MARFRKRPVVIDAVQYKGEAAAILDFISASEADKIMFVPRERPESRQLLIKTLEGEVTCSYGDWLIRGVNGELYPCKPDIFAKTYDEVEPAQQPDIG